ncbi:MAG TPA: C45 family peptidase [Deinococcales bacterium]|nr:C45 family peptidase [Deinococcales bacterium]
MSLPLVRLSGSAYEQGLAHGEALRERIATNLQLYFDRFRREARLTRDETLGMAGRLLDVVRASDPGYASGIEGIAAGSGFDVLEIAALNVRYEILYYQFGINATLDAQHLTDGIEPPAQVTDGCTSFAVLPEAMATGHLTIGQNWDWIPAVRGAVLHTVEEDGLETVAFTEAGIFGGKLGMNSAGLGLCINGLTTTTDDWARPVSPVHVRTRRILRSRRFEDAVSVVRNEARACAVNLLVAQAPDRAVDLEAAPDVVRQLECEGGCVVHANHFLDPAGMGISEPPNERRPHSYNRQRRMRELLESRQPLAIADLQDFLRDHEDYPDSICRHPNPADPDEEHYATVTAVIMDLEERRMLITDGNPDESEFQEFKLG